MKLGGIKESWRVRSTPYPVTVDKQSIYVYANGLETFGNRTLKNATFSWGGCGMSGVVVIALIELAHIHARCSKAVSTTPKESLNVESGCIISKSVYTPDP